MSIYAETRRKSLVSTEQKKKERTRTPEKKQIPASPNQKKLLALPGQQVLSYERSSRSSPSTRNWRPLGHRWRATIASSTLHWTGARNGPTPGRSVFSSVLSLAPSEPTRALQKKRHRTVRAHRRKRPITGAYPIRPAKKAIPARVISGQSARAPAR